MNETFGQRFQRLRKNLGLTQDEVSNKVNVTPQAISKWENDISIPDVSLLIELADLFNISVDELLGRETKKTTIAQGKDINKLVLKIQISSINKDKVNINLPLPIIRACLNTSSSFNIKGKDLGSIIDFKEIISLVEQGVIGELVNIESNNGDIVKVFVE